MAGLGTIGAAGEKSGKEGGRKELSYMDDLDVEEFD